VNSLTASTSDNANETITKRTHLTEDDDCTSFTHTLPLEYDDLPELVIKDFGKSIPITPPNQKNRKSEGGIGHPPNAPVRKSKSTSRVSKGQAATAARAVKLPPPTLVNIDDDEFYEDSQDPDAIVPSATPKKRKRQTSATPPPTQPASKKRRGLTPPPATLPIDINDGFYDNTPPPATLHHSAILKMTTMMITIRTALSKILMEQMEFMKRKMEKMKGLKTKMKSLKTKMRESNRLNKYHRRTKL